ncbi:MAG: hypothetical protein AAFU64_04600 [Bacteroidota bacterium]
MTKSILLFITLSFLFISSSVAQDKPEQLMAHKWKIVKVEPYGDSLKNIFAAMPEEIQKQIEKSFAKMTQGSYVDLHSDKTFEILMLTPDPQDPEGANEDLSTGEWKFDLIDGDKKLITIEEGGRESKLFILELDNKKMTISDKKQVIMYLEH